MLEIIKRFRLIEWGIIQAILCSLLWLGSDYIALLVTIIFVPILFSVLVISIISERIEKSKVPRIYFLFLVQSIAIFVAIGFIFKVLMQSDFSFD